MYGSKKFVAAVLVGASGVATAALATGNCPKPNFSVVPFENDQGTRLVAAEWRRGIGCPRSAPFDPNTTTPQNGCIFADPAQPTQPFGPPSVPDTENQGLLLAKTGPTATLSDPTGTNVAAGAYLPGVKGIYLCELGYDIRKPDNYLGGRGGHCGPRAARFEINTRRSDGSLQTNYMFGDGCQFPPPVDVLSEDTWWQRLRWGPDASGALNACNSPIPTACDPLSATYAGVTNIYGAKVDSIRIVFDEGQDMPDSNFALTVLDNIDVNGKLVGNGPTTTSYGDEDRGQGKDDDGDETDFSDSPSHAESSSVAYTDGHSGMKMQSINGAKSVTYTTGPLGERCVNLVGDAIVNGNSGYTYTLVSCDLSLVGADIGNFNLNITGPLGSIPYAKAAKLSSGYVALH